MTIMEIVQFAFSNFIIISYASEVDQAKVIILDEIG